MTTVSSCARHSSNANKRCLNCMAVIVNTKYVFCCGFTVIAIAHLRKHLLSSCACADIENASDASVGLAKRAIALVAEESRKLSMQIVFPSCFAVTFLAYIDVQERRSTLRRLLTWLLSSSLACVELEPTRGISEWTIAAVLTISRVNLWAVLLLLRHRTLISACKIQSS